MARTPYSSLGTSAHRAAGLRRVGWKLVIAESPFGTGFGHLTQTEGKIMNSIVYIVGLVVIVLFLLSFFGLR